MVARYTERDRLKDAITRYLDWLSTGDLCRLEMGLRWALRSGYEPIIKLQNSDVVMTSDSTVTLHTTASQP